MQLPINPTDNDRLKTTKVTRMLDEIGVLPAAHNQRPSFLRSRRTAAVLIDRALANLAPDPSARKHCCNNASDFAGTLNEKFTVGTVHGGGSGDSNPPVVPLIESNFRDGVHKINGSAVTLEDIWTENATDWGSWPGATIEPGVGYVKQSATGPDYTFSDNASPVLASGLFPTYLGEGFTALLEGSVVYTEHPFDEGATEQQLLLDIGIVPVSFPDYSSEWFALVEAQKYITQASGTIYDSQNAQFYNNNGGESVIDDDGTGLISPFIFRLAFSYSATGFTFSLNGRPLQTVAAETPPSFTDVVLYYRLSTQLIETICGLEYVAFYPKFENDADLMTLTAP